jgi:hypothetical protein
MRLILVKYYNATVWRPDIIFSWLCFVSVMPCVHSQLVFKTLQSQSWKIVIDVYIFKKRGKIQRLHQYTLKKYRHGEKGG